MSEQTSIQAKKTYISVLNVVSCLAVVLLHANGVFWDFKYERYWLTANIIECVFYFAVPEFFMITGCTLIDYHVRYSTKEYLKKRIEKTVIPFFIWSIFAFVYMHIMAGLEYRGIRLLISDVFNTNILSIYWFFIPLFAVYLCIPALGMIPVEHRKKIFGYLIIVAFALNVLLPFLCSLTGIQMNGQLSAYMVQSYLLYVLIGYYVDRYPIKKKYRILIYGLGIAGLLAHIIGTWVFSYRDGSVSGVFKGYLNVPCFFYAVAIFVAFRYMNDSKLMKLCYRWISWFSGATFGIYLIHRYVLDTV